ncbi:25S rRNA (adenine645-N1)-methyltransferase [Tilletia horrida]|nr:25S rRNA (adenine645-N1)-methyltransferase [Tilletia horrida]
MSSSGKDKKGKKAAAADAEVDAIQAQLERNQTALAESILAKLSAVTEPGPTTATQTKKQQHKERKNGLAAAGSAPRSSTLGLGATPVAGSSAQSANGLLSEADARLRGRLVSKRKRDVEEHGDHEGSSSSAATAPVNIKAHDEEEDAGRSSAVSKQSAKAKASPKDDIFAQAAKKQKKQKQQQQQQQQGAADKAASDTNGGATAEPQTLSKAQRKKLRKKAQQEALASQAGQTTDSTAASAPSSASNVSVKNSKAPATSLLPTTAPELSIAESPALTPLQKSMTQKLSGARFRTINETLYTTPSTSALSLMQKEPDTLAAYHQGFREQVKGWPKNPVDVLAKRIIASASASNASRQSLLIADLGAGEAPLAKALESTLPSAKVLAFDLLTSPDGRIVGADCARHPFGVPLPGDPISSSVPASVRRAVDNKKSAKARASGASIAENGAAGSQHTNANPQAVVDAVVFCLSLMPTNWVDMIFEARRIMREGGELYIAEVASRFNTLDDFVSILERLGFKLADKDDSNTHFTILHLRLMKDVAVWNQWKATKGQEWEKDLGAAESDLAAYRAHLVQEGSKILKPCLYKRR